MEKDEAERADLERENQRLRELVSELDELPREKRAGTVSDLKSVQDIPTSVSKGIRSMPGGQDRYYLDLYLLQKERERLKKETTSIKKRRLRIGRKVADISKDMAEKEEKALQGMEILSAEPATKSGQQPETAAKDKTPKKYEYKEEEWKTVSMEY